MGRVLSTQYSVLTELGRPLTGVRVVNTRRIWLFGMVQINFPRLIIQRSYCDRKAKYLADLEDRCRKAEEENERLRNELELT
jgi:hypothetical protein